MAKQASYSEKDIQVLSPIEGIRRKATMYIGSTDGHGVFHILKEVVDNAVDEAIAKRNDAIYIAINGDEIWVGDDGHGIPTGKHPKTKLSTLETVLTMTHAGGKFGTDAYATAIGTHGVGVTATNALSSEFTAWSNYTGAWQTMAFQKGIKTGELAKAKAPTMPGGFKPTGTIIRFKFDKTIFEKGAKLDLKSVEHWCEMTAYLNANLRVQFFDGKQSKAWRFPKGIDDLLDLRLKQNKLKEMNRLSVKEIGFDLCLSWVEEGDEKVEYFTNTSVNRLGGTHERTLWKALFDTLEGYSTKDQEFEIADIRDSIIGVFNIKLGQPEFYGQTKDKLVDKRGTEVYEFIETHIAKFFKKNKQLALDLCEKAALLFEHRQHSITSKSLARKLKSAAKTGTLLPGKLTSAPRCKPEERELFLVEGDSAAGPSVAARMHIDRQEILALKGKPINAARTDVERYSTNDEVFNILLAIGFDPAATDPMKNLRVKSKIVFLADPDVDGQHINLLLLTLFSIVVPQVFDKGMVYIAQVPEYMATIKGKRYYGRTKVDLEKNLPKGANVAYQHIKGYGEVPPIVIRETAFDPATRILTQITVSKAKELQKFIGLMSDDDEARKGLLGL